MTIDLDEPITDDELAELALAADPNTPVAADAVPLDVYLGADDTPLPQWYMAAPMARHVGRWRRWVIWGFVAALLAIEAVGLCSTYGQLPFH